jgi:ABC-type transport system involved in multi-copper enzyme maturation permease subunit
MDAQPEIAEIAPAPRRKWRPRLPAWLVNNPIIMKEMRGRMRSWRSIIMLTGYIFLLAGFVGMIYMSFRASGGGGPNINARRELGRSIFFTIYILQLFVVCFASPSLTAGAISSERERQTFDLLRTTLLKATFLVFGKLSAAISFMILLMMAALPLQSIAFLFGGISGSEMIVGTLILLLTTVMFGTIGIFFSSLVARTRVATALSQVTVMVLVFGLPVVLLFLTILFDSQFNFIQNSLVNQIAVFVVGWLIAVASPMTTAILTEVILSGDQSWLYTTTNLTGGFNLFVPSPWLGFVVLYPLLTVLLLFFAVRLVRRAEK